MINRYDAAEIANKVSDTFRVLVSHRGVDLTGDEIKRVRNICTHILEEKIDNSQILNRQLNTTTGEVEEIASD